MEELIVENIKLKEENEILKKKIEKYVASDRHKNYYQENKEKIKQNAKEYREKTNYNEKIPIEKKKQYARTAYLNKKAKEDKINEDK